MKSVTLSVLAVAALALGWAVFSPHAISGNTNFTKNDPVATAVEKGAKWLVSTQGKDGGWGQDGGETSYVRQGENLESNGNDVANTAVAATALLHAGSTPTKGEYQAALMRAVDFILRHVDQSPAEGLEVTTLRGTQIQRKLGPCIDTFLTSKLLAELDGEMGNTRANAHVRQALQKCVAKIQKNQLKDGSWNIAGGWAPILGTSLASRSLYVAQQKGVAVSEMEPWPRCRTTRPMPHKAQELELAVVSWEALVLRFRWHRPESRSTRTRRLWNNSAVPIKTAKRMPGGSRP